MVIQTCMNINTSLPSSQLHPGFAPPPSAHRQVTISRALKSDSRSCELSNLRRQDEEAWFNKLLRQSCWVFRHKKSRVHTRSSRLFQLFRWTGYLNQLHVTYLMLKGHHGHTLTDITDSFFLVKLAQPSKKWPIISRIQVRRREFISSLDIPLEHVLLRTHDRPREIFYLARSDLNIASAISTLWN